MDDDVVKPKNCFEFATNSWGKYGEGERAQWATFRPSISRDENAQTLVVIVLHIITIPSAYAGWPRELEARAALELSKLSFLVTPPISLLCVFVIRTFLRGRFLRRDLFNFFNVSDIGICLLQKRALLIRDIEILILLQVKILINDVENFYIVDTFPSDCDIYIYMYIKSNNWRRLMPGIDRPYQRKIHGYPWNPFFLLFRTSH